MLVSSWPLLLITSVGGGGAGGEGLPCLYSRSTFIEAISSLEGVLPKNFNLLTLNL